jgi:sugar/nucleoside kinase (ribokinase family)
MTDDTSVNRRVLVVGDVNIDIILTGLPNIPLAEQETFAQGFEIVVGGQAGTIARAMSRLGLAVTFVGKVGDDDYGRRAVNDLVQSGVDVSGVVVDSSLRTGVTVVLSTGQERAFATYLGSISQLRRTDVRLEFISSAHHLHVGSYYLQRALRSEILDLFQEAKRYGLTTSIDPGWDVSEEWGDDILEVLGYVDVLLPNEVEAMSITGTDVLEQALDVLASVAGTVVIKMGEKGCLAGNKKQTLYGPGFKVPVVDVTSAGDIFNAGFLYGFLHGWSLKKSARFANACGAMSVSEVGSAGIIASVTQVRDFLAARNCESLDQGAK